MKTKVKLLRTDDQVLTHEFEVSTHEDNTYQLKEEGLKCQHMWPESVNTWNPKSVDVELLDFLTQSYLNQYLMLQN